MKRVQEIQKFIGSLDGWEIKFVEDTIAIARNFRQYIADCGKEMTPEKFCEQMKIQKKDFNKFVSGNWNYSLEHIAILEFHWTEWKKSKTKVNVVSIPNQEKDAPDKP